MQSYRVAGTTLAYTERGHGPPLLLVHAFPLSSQMWQAQVAALADRYRVITPDTRGFGASELGPDLVTMRTYATDLITLLDQLGLPQVIGGGLSMGGYILMELLRQAPHRLSRLILADTRPQADGAEAQQAREINAQLAETQGVVALVEKLLPGLVASQASATLREQIRAMAQPQSAAGVAAALRAMATRADSTSLLTTVDLPTLVIVGSQDALTPPAVAATMAASMPNAQLVELANVGHLSNLEDPAGFNAAVATFLG